MVIDCRITKVRVSRWINTDTFTDLFGIEVRTTDKWYHLAIDGKAALFDTLPAAAQKAEEVKRQVGISP